MALPLPTENQAFCNVSALKAGLIGLLDEMFITKATPGHVTTAPSLSFLLQHSQNSQKLVFDLGIRKDWENYPPTVVKSITSGTYPVQVDRDVVESLEKGGTSPTEIDYVCISHCHWDHVGNTTPFTRSTFLVGGGAQSLFKPGYPADPKASFASDLLPEGRTMFLDPTAWVPIGPFPRALDFFGDGSLYIVDSPGHLAGHINILARTSSDGGWVYLGGDSAHHWNLITLESEIAVEYGGHAHCAHIDKDAAQEHLRRINKIWKTPRVNVIIAHDEPWYRENKDGPTFWPGTITSK